MADEYGLEPSAETLELVARIRAAGAEGREPGGLPLAPAFVSEIAAAPPEGRLAAGPSSRTGRGLGGTLAGAGAALVGAAAVAWVLLSSGVGTSTTPALESAAPVVVVLPVAVSGSVSPDYGDLARALTTELTTRLGEVPGLLVVPTESVEPHLRETQDPMEVGRRLQSDAVVESRLRWEPSGVETSSRVIDVLTGETLWDASHSYPHTEILNAQLDLTVGLASALNVRLATIPRRDLTFSSEGEFQAWSLASMAMDTIGAGTLDSGREAAARTLIQKALVLVPDFAPAYAAQAFLYTRIWRARREESRWLDSAVVTAERAVGLDPDHYFSQLALSNAMGTACYANPHRYPASMERRGAEAALRALQLSPSSPEAANYLASVMERAGRVGRQLFWAERNRVLRRNWLGIQNNRAHKFWLLGDYDAAIEARRLVLEVTPRDPPPTAYRIPEYNLSRGRLEEARQQIEAVRAQDPDNIGSFAVAIYLDLITERFEEAENLIEELLSRDPPVLSIHTSNFFPRTALGYVYLRTGRTREGKRLLELVRDTRLDQVRLGTGYISHYDLARIYAMLGETEEALHLLRIAIDRGWPFYYTEMGRTDPMLKNLLGHEEFEAIMGDLKAKLDAEREWVQEMLALPEQERFKRMLMDAERQVETLWEAQRATG
jgi:tetratricopeptide (TPR) repeat protein/TolB-like protein